MNTLRGTCNRTSRRVPTSGIAGDQEHVAAERRIARAAVVSSRVANDGEKALRR